MKTTRWFSLLVIVLLTFACSQKKPNTITVSNIQFTHTVDLSYETVETDFMLSYPICILLTKDYLVLQDDRGHPFFYHVIDKKTGKLCFEFGEQGRGPIDMLSTSKNPHYDQKEGIIQMFDANKKAILYNSIQENKLSNTSIFDLSSKYSLFILQFFDFNDFYLALGKNGTFRDFQFITFNKSFEMIEAFGEYPILDNDTQKSKKINEDVFNIYFLKISPNLKHFAFASYKIGLLEIFETDKLPYEIVKKRSILLAPPYRNDDVSQNIYGFEDIFVTDNYIYALYNGKTAKENPYFTKSIKVFDWDGRFIIEYNVGVDLRCLSVDEQERRIYAVAYTDEEGFFLVKTDIIEYI